MVLRRSSKAWRMVSIDDWSPVRASMAAYWETAVRLEVVWLIILAIPAIISGSATAKPTRQPVMA